MTTAATLLPPPTRVEIDGVPTATYEYGTASANRTAVLCHGTPWSAETWAPVAHRLSDAGLRVLLWDMPGYGRSAQGPDVRVDLGTQMARLASLLRHWELEHPHVMAHDVGGAVALGAHLLHGAEMGSLHVWDPVMLEPWGSPFFRLVAEHTDVFDALPAPLHRALVREYLAGAAPSGLTDAWLDRLTLPWLDSVGQRAFSRQIAALSPADTRPVASRLGDVRCPVAVGWGGDDPWIPVAQAHRLAEALGPDTPVNVLDGAGHLTPVERESEVAALILEHLAG